MRPGDVPERAVAATSVCLRSGRGGSERTGLVFAIPGAEVKIDGQWIAYDSKNKDLILAQNPMDLEWRLNGSLLRKYSYAPGQTVQGQIVTVDDQWNGLRLEKDISVQIRWILRSLRSLRMTGLSTPDDKRPVEAGIIIFLSSR